MRPQLCAGVALALTSALASPASAQGAPPPQGGGQAQTRADMEAHAAATHKRLDLNGDGYVTREEIMQVVAPQPDKAARQPSLASQIAERMFVEGDADHDGRITLAEAIAAADRSFDRADTNHDGAVTAEEAVAAMMAMGRGSATGISRSP